MLGGSRLLPLLLDCRSSLLSGRLGRGLRLRRRWARALEFLLPPGRLLGRSLLLDVLLPALPRRFLPLSRHGRSLHMFLVVLPHYGVARLVAVALADQRLLLLHRPGITIS